MVQVSANTKVCIVGLYGLGGIGKTTISKALCNSLLCQFCDNVCHIELGSGGDMELWKALKKFINIRHVVLDKLDDMGEMISRYWRWQECIEKEVMNVAVQCWSLHVPWRF